METRDSEAQERVPETPGVASGAREVGRRRVLGWGLTASLALASFGRRRATAREDSGPTATAERSPRGTELAAVEARRRDEETAEHLRELILQRALGSTDPWLEMHVVLGLGADIANQRGNLLDQAVRDSLVLSPAGFRKVPHFPLAVERHPFHFLQVMQATAVPLDRVFITSVGRFTQREILEGSEALFVPQEVTDELSWVVSVLTQAFTPDRDRFVNAAGETISVSRIVERHLRETEAAYATTFAAMEGRGLYRRGLLHTKACNGTHLLYGLIDALANGYQMGQLRPRLERLIAATLFRAQVEPLLIDKSLRGDLPMVRLNADAAKLTFFGHVIEDLGQARRRGVFTPSSEQEAAVAQCRAELARLVDRLTGEHDLDALRTEVPNAYRVLLGDACHALRGIRMWL